jgi:hypothetical protein
MTDDAPAIFVALEQSGFGAAIRQSTWIYPAANIGHIVALVVFAGSIAMMDVRLLGGLSATAPGRLLARARAFAIVAFVGMLITGSVLFTAEASHLIVNPVFQLKVALIGAGLVNLVIYELVARRAVADLPPGATLPSSARIAGVVSLSVWVAVATCGRSIAYF